MTTRYVEQVMGMPISLALRGQHSKDGQALKAWGDVISELRWVDLVFSTWKPHSAISRLARGEITLAECPPEVSEVLALGERAKAESGGAFSIYHRGTLDPTGVVKGWAVERAARNLRTLSATSYCLSAGGDMVCLTRGSDSAPWQIGIEHPTDPQRLIASVPIFTGAVATSGTAHRGEHLVDARTGRSAQGLASVTVMAESLTWADIDATAAYAMGSEAASWLTSRQRGFVVVHPDGCSEVGDPVAA